jgi:hypothetical protein
VASPVLRHDSLTTMADDLTLPTTVRTGDAASLGLTRTVWLGPELTAVRRGVRVTAGVDPLDPDVRIAAVASQLPDHAALGGWAAARLHERVHAGDDLEVFDGAPRWDDGRRAPRPYVAGLARVPVCASRHSRLVLREDVRVFRSEVTADERQEIGGAPVSSALRTAFDLARLLPTAPAVVGLDRLVHVGALTVEDLQLLVDARPGAHGRATARRALGLVDGGAESPQETVLRLAWLGAGLPRPAANRVITDLDGRFVARVDLLDPDVGVVGEYDGAVHSGAGRRSRDARRQEELESLGLVVVRATSVDVDGTVAVARWQRRLRAAYHRAHRRPANARRWRVG